MVEARVIYTIAEESKYVKVTGVAPYQLQTELEQRCRANGRLICLSPLPSSPETLTSAFLLTFEDYLEAKKAKKALHKQSFYGFELCFRYEPALESVAETYNKLQMYERQRLLPKPTTATEVHQEEAVPEPVPVKRRRI